MVFKFNIGDIVQSGYRGRWIGVITDRISRKKPEAPLYRIMRVLDGNGHPLSKAQRMERDFDEYWLKAYTPKSPKEAEIIALWANPTSSWSELQERVQRVASRYLDAVQVRPLPRR